MTLLDQQLHGYRQGHQLLSASVKLLKPDQEIVDRLSDVAGPLRPGDRFEPYLTCYPLPSGSHYVLARTWQDFEAPRAGCVRTRSLIVPMSEWLAGTNIMGLVETISREGPSAPAERVQASHSPRPLPHVGISQGLELVEALFLEDRKPIVVFDATNPEGIILRLLTAFWPSFRRTFAASSFALSPRSLGGRSFDLVFAPKDARSRFSDWSGRRIDARKPVAARHRWSHEIVDRVFSGDSPSLLRDNALGDLSSEHGGAEAELRISLLWNELHEKLETSPNAVLGLLDIANSRTNRNISAIRQLEPELVRAAEHAVVTLSSFDAWRFLLALTDKLCNVQLSLSAAKAIRGAAIQLANRAPIDAVENVEMLATALGRDLLLSALGDGIAQGFDSKRAAALMELHSSSLLEMLLLSPALAKASLTRHPGLSARLATALGEATAETRGEAKRRLLRLLVDDRQAEAALILIAELGRDELLAEAAWLFAANGLSAESLHGPMVERARSIGVVAELRDSVARFPDSKGVDALLFKLLAPVPEDLQWLLDTQTLGEKRRVGLLRRLISSGAAGQIDSMILGHQQDSVLRLLMRDPARSLDVVDRLLDGKDVAPRLAVDATLQLLPYANIDRARQLASRALAIILPHDTGEGRDSALDNLLATMGSDLDGAWAIREGLKWMLPGDVVAANLSAFNRSPPAVRQRLMLAIEDLARAIVYRRRIDYSEYAVADAASLLWDSAVVDQQAFCRSSVTLLPFLLRCQSEPASPLIAAAFPSVYQELRKADDAVDYFKFFFFAGLDKCKIARHELVEALVRSVWRATDIALAAARAGDIDRVLRRIAKHAEGVRIIADIESNLSSIPEPWRCQVSEALTRLRNDGLSLHESAP